MKLSDLKQILPTLENVEFQLENGTFIPEHFHVTEVGMITKNFIDCGGVIRNEKVVNFQLWNADDLEHRLNPGKLLNIIQLSEEKLDIQDYEIEHPLTPNDVYLLSCQFLRVLAFLEYLPAVLVYGIWITILYVQETLPYVC